MVIVSIKLCLIRLSNDKGLTLLPPPPPHLILSRRYFLVIKIRKATGNLLAIPASQELTTSAPNSRRFPLHNAVRKFPVTTHRSHLRRYQTITRIVKGVIGCLAFLSTPDLPALTLLRVTPASSVPFQRHLRPQWLGKSGGAPNVATTTRRSLECVVRTGLGELPPRYR